MNIHEQANIVADRFRAAGHTVRVDHSTNRNGDLSSYLEVSGVREQLRLSDHFSGSVTAVMISADCTPASFFAKRDAAVSAAAAKAQAEQAVLAERDAPYRARYMAAKQHEQHAIICEIYPGAAHDKAVRRAIVARWEK